MSRDPLAEQLAALDAFASHEDAALAGATRLRVRASLERGHAWQRHAGLLTALAVLLVASASWALATGRLKRWLVPPPLPAALSSRAAPHTPSAPAPIVAAVSAPLAPTAASSPSVVAVRAAKVVAVPAASVVPAPAVTVVPAPAVTVVPAPAAALVAPAATAAPAPAVPADPAARTANHAVQRGQSDAPRADVAANANALYARAHELHFHGDDPSAALAAWDAYLAAEPSGAFAVEAHYNRALCLVRLGRLAEARTALEPFAHGDVEPRGYRQTDAAHLIERIDEHSAHHAHTANANAANANANALNGSR